MIQYEKLTLTNKLSQTSKLFILFQSISLCNSYDCTMYFNDDRIHLIGLITQIKKEEIADSYHDNLTVVNTRFVFRAIAIINSTRMST